MTEKLDVAIIGAGQAGLATSWYLKQAGVDHVVLEAGRVAETWRTRRWDSFCLVTPNWSVKLPGGEYSGPDPDGYMSLAQLVEHFQGWADSFDAPVLGQSEVSAMEPDGDGFALTVGGRKLQARTVVVASGGYQRAHVPPGADKVPSGVTSLLAEQYTNPDALRPGAVLIVGSGQTGCQLAEELHESGRKVILACGRCSWAPRRFGGHDIVWWVVESGFWNRTLDQLPSPAMRLLGNVQASGHDGGHDLHHRVLAQKGVELVGRYQGAEGRTIGFADDLNQTLAACDGLAALIKKYVDDLCGRRGLTHDWEMPPPMTLEARTLVDVDREGISTVIWTSGYRPDYGWVRFPVFDDMGFPVQVDGRTAVPGLYFMGVHYQRKVQSAVIYGAREDAEIVARHIVENRR